MPKRGATLEALRVRCAASRETQICDGPDDDIVLDCKTLAPSVIKNHLFERGKLRWWKNKQADEMEDGVRFEPVKALSQKKCNERWTPERAAYSRSSIINGAFTQESRYRYLKVKDNQSEICGRP